MALRRKGRGLRKQPTHDPKRNNLSIYIHNASDPAKMGEWRAGPDQGERLPINCFHSALMGRRRYVAGRIALRSAAADFGEKP
jgi:hypothetical protein